MITVNGATITDQEIAREVQYHPASSLERATRDASIALVVRALLLQEAAALGVSCGGDGDPSAREEQSIAAVLDHAIALPDPDEQTCRRYYENHREKFRSPDLFEASHILFAAPPHDPAERERARAAADATLRELREDPRAFERLARERSADPESREQGGHMGQITRGQTTPEFEACLARLSEGELCAEPVATRYGWHLVRLDRAVRGRQLTFEMAKERVAEYLGASAWTRAVHQYIQILVGRSRIEGIELDGAATPLVQ